MTDTVHSGVTEKHRRSLILGVQKDISVKIVNAHWKMEHELFVHLVNLPPKR